MKILSTLLGVTLFSMTTLQATGFASKPKSEAQKNNPIHASHETPMILDPYHTTDTQSSCFTVSAGYWFGELFPSNRVIASQASVPSERTEDLARSTPATYSVDLQQGINLALTYASANEQRIFLDYTYFSGSTKASPVEATSLVSSWPIANLVTGETANVTSASGAYDVKYHNELALYYMRELFISPKKTVSIFLHSGLSGTFRELSLLTTYLDTAFDPTTYKYNQSETRMSGGGVVAVNTTIALANHFGLYGSLAAHGHVGSFESKSKETVIAPDESTTSGLNQSITNMRFFQEFQARVGLFMEYETAEGSAFGFDVCGLFGVEPDGTALAVPQTSSTTSTMIGLFRAAGRINGFIKF